MPRDFSIYESLRASEASSSESIVFSAISLQERSASSSNCVSRDKMSIDIPSFMSRICSARFSLKKLFINIAVAKIAAVITKAVTYFLKFRFLFVILAPVNAHATCHLYCCTGKP